MIHLSRITIIAVVPDSFALSYGVGVGVGLARPTWITTCAVFVLCNPRESVTVSRAG